MTTTKNQMATSWPETPRVTAFSDALDRLGKLTEELSDSLHRAINVARPHLVTDPLDIDKAPMGEAPVPMASPFCHEIRFVNTRLEGILELLNRFGSNFDT